jgi:hypothetical protein
MKSAVNLFELVGRIRDGDVIEDQGFEYLIRVVNAAPHRRTGFPQLSVTVIALNPDRTESNTRATRACECGQTAVFDTVYDLVGDVALNLGRFGRDPLHGLTLTIEDPEP